MKWNWFFGGAIAGTLLAICLLIVPPITDAERAAKGRVMSKQERETRRLAREETCRVLVEAGLVRSCSTTK